MANLYWKIKWMNDFLFHLNSQPEFPQLQANWGEWLGTKPGFYRNYVRYYGKK